MAVLATLTVSAQHERLSPKAEMALRKLTMAELALKTLYIDTLDESKLTDAAIKGMLSQLDTHTSQSPKVLQRK